METKMLELFLTPNR